MGRYRANKLKQTVFLLISIVLLILVIILGEKRII